MTKPVDIAVVGKYVSLPDAYLSVTEALKHAGVFHDRKVNVHLVDGEDSDIAADLEHMDGILVPGGFGARAFGGKVNAVRYAREHDIPFLGICLGLQATVVEFARNVVGLANANSSEFDETTENPVIHIMPDQEDIEDKGGTMRLGAYPCKVVSGTQAAATYGSELIYERHRHRYEVNNAYREVL